LITFHPKKKKIVTKLIEADMVQAELVGDVKPAKKVVI
jgi:hypothetical protein